MAPEVECPACQGLRINYVFSTKWSRWHHVYFRRDPPYEIIKCPRCLGKGSIPTEERRPDDATS
jgi:hypothetical protein